jgi:hypothetical protein
MIKEYPKKFSRKLTFPWSKNLFKVDETSLKLSEAKLKRFHTFVMKGMFSCKHARHVEITLCEGDLPFPALLERLHQEVNSSLNNITGRLLCCFDPNTSILNVHCIH